jgi:hypothetical protein
MTKDSRRSFVGCGRTCGCSRQRCSSCRDFDDCVECHRNADDEPEHGERRKGGGERGHGDDGH